MTSKKLLALFLSLCMIFSLTVLPAAAADTETPKEAPTFTDIDTHWGKEVILAWASRGLLKGNNGAFMPDNNMTRGEVATLFSRVMGYQVTAKNAFPDLKADAWYTTDVLKANAAGILNGDGTSARPEAVITRQETAVMMARMLALTGEAGATAGFNDADQIADWALDAMTAMEAKGYIKGFEGAVRPTANITRAEVVQMLDNTLAKFYDAAGTYTENVTGTMVISAGDVTVKGIKVEGDVIVAEGVADGNVTLDKVAITGKLIIRGGGTKSVNVINGSTVDTIEMDRRHAPVRVNTDRNSTVHHVVVNNATAGTQFDGKYADITVVGANTNVTVTGAVTAVTIAESAIGSTVVAAKGATVATITTAANDVTINGEGKVTAVKVENGTGTKVETPNTRVTVSKDAGAVTIPNGEIKTGATGNTQGTTTGGGGGSSVTFADMVAAPLHDVRAVAGATVGTFVADEDLVSGYSVTGVVSGNNNVDVTITGTRLMEHEAGNNELGYWVGVGIPYVEGDTYDYAVGDFDFLPDEFDFTDSSDSSIEKNGKTYNTFYFDVDEDLSAYVAVKNADDEVTVYNIDMSYVQMTPDIENVEAWIVHDEATYNMLPDSYLELYPWLPAYEDDGSPADLPWLAVTYDSNTTGELEFEVAKDFEVLEPNPAKISVTTINTDRYQTWHLEEQDDGRDHLGLAPDAIYGTYDVMLSKSDMAAYDQAPIYKKPGATYFFVTFVVDGETIDSREVVEGSTLNVPDYDKDGYEFVGWFVGEKKWDNATDTVTGATTLTAKFIPLYTINYNLNGGTMTGTLATTYTIETPTITLPLPTKVGYDFGGWCTYPDGGDHQHVKPHPTQIPQGSTGDQVFYAVWNRNPIAAVNDAGLNAAEMQLALETHATALGIADNADYKEMDASRKPSVARYVIDSKPEIGGFTTPDEIRAAFEAGVAFESAKWALSTKIMNNVTTLADVKLIGLAYAAHGEYRVSIDKFSEDEGAALGVLLVLLATVDETDIKIVHAQFADVNNHAPAGAFTNPYRLNDVFQFVLGIEEDDDEVNTHGVAGVTAVKVEAREGVYNVYLFGTGVASGVPLTGAGGALENVFFNPDAAVVKTQDILTTAIGKHTVVGLKLGSTFTEATKYTLVQVNEALAAYVGDSNVSAGAPWTKTTERTGAVLNAEGYALDLLVQPGKDNITLTVSDGTEKELTINVFSENLSFAK